MPISKIDIDENSVWDRLDPANSKFSTENRKDLIDYLISDLLFGKFEYKLVLSENCQDLVFSVISIPEYCRHSKVIGDNTLSFMDMCIKSIYHIDVGASNKTIYLPGSFRCRDKEEITINLAKSKIYDTKIYINNFCHLLKIYQEFCAGRALEVLQELESII